MKKGFIITAAMVSIGMIGAAATATPKGQAGIQAKKGEVVVKLKSDTFSINSMQAHALLSDLANKYDVSVNPLMTDDTYVTVKAEGNVGLGDLLANVSANPAVEYAEPNFIYHAFELTPGDEPKDTLVPNDPNFKLNWGLWNFGQQDSKGQVGVAGADIGATKAWKLNTGDKTILVASIDTGVDYTHEDLKDNIFVNAKETAGNGKDDDGNGFIDDVHGWNFNGKNNNPMDDNEHGTHTSGTIGAVGNNGVGTAGVAWNVRILPVKFLSSQGSGTLADAVDSIKYATKMGVNIMSNSWGGGGFSQAMFDAIKEAQDKGILFVAAAGNDSSNNDSKATYPAGYKLDNVVAVAALDNRDGLASFSNYGKTTVHLGAPGVNVYSTIPMSMGKYATFSGTSMACPHVSGAAALLWGANKSFTYKDVKDRLMATVTPVASVKQKTISGGRLNIFNALSNTSEKPQDPSNWKSIQKAIESKHPYDNSDSQTFEVSQPGAKYVRLHISKLDTEAGYDLVRIKDAKGNVVEELSGKLEDYTTAFAEGEKLTIEFSSDSSVNSFGFAIDKVEFAE